MSLRRSAAAAASFARVAVPLLWLGCRSEPPPPPPPPPAPLAIPAPPAVERAPRVTPSTPTRVGRTPAPLKADPELKRVRELLHRVVMQEARDPENPWAIAHAMLALGNAEPLTSGADPVDWLFTRYAKVARVGDEDLVGFPAREGAIRIEPHTDLVLKALVETGVPPDRKIQVEGREFTVLDLYRHSLWRAWIKGDKTGFQEAGFNDTPWALQALSGWAPPEASWMAAGGRDMTMDRFTDAVVEQLVHETRFMAEAKRQGQLVQKDTRQGLFRYTCGGQHLVQGAAYAVARGFGAPEHKARMCDQLDLLVWRIDVELNAIDPLINSGDRAIATVLLGQRLKFLGHFLETEHRIAATGLCPLEGERAAAGERVAAELIRTVDALSKLGIWDTLDAVKSDPTLAQYRMGGAEQVYLDFVGDSAHAVRGIDLATGVGTISY